MNLAGVLPWIHWRGLLILGLLVAGNVFCMACPFLLPRTLARRWLPRRLDLAALAAEQVAGGAAARRSSSGPTRRSPCGTARGGPPGSRSAISSRPSSSTACSAAPSFCKYVCPIGQFNFVQSLVSPLEVKVRDPAVCASCRTKDCIRGRDGIPGCELHLFQPRKVGQHGLHLLPRLRPRLPARQRRRLIAGFPAAELWHDRQRSGIGRFSRRRDLAALVLVLVFGAFANAAGMVGPVVEWQDRLASLVGVRSPLLATTAFYLLAWSCCRCWLSAARPR